MDPERCESGNGTEWDDLFLRKLANTLWDMRIKDVNAFRSAINDALTDSTNAKPNHPRLVELSSEALQRGVSQEWLGDAFGKALSRVSGLEMIYFQNFAEAMLRERKVRVCNMPDISYLFEDGRIEGAAAYNMIDEFNLNDKILRRALLPEDENMDNLLLSVKSVPNDDKNMERYDKKYDVYGKLVPPIASKGTCDRSECKLMEVYVAGMQFDIRESFNASNGNW